MHEIAHRVGPVALCLLLGVARTSLAAAPAGQVSFLTGTAERNHAGQSEALAVGSPIAVGDEVITAGNSRLEILLADKSAVRLDENSKLVIQQADFGGAAGHKKFQAKLALGKLWSKVTSVLGGQGRFEVATDNAVAGVRGTTFRVDAHADRSVLVRVYAGAVAVASPGQLVGKSSSSGRHEVPGPSQVSKQKYEKLLAAMMQVKVASDGEIGEPQRFAEADDAKDSWVAWNQRRDGE